MEKISSKIALLVLFIISIWIILYNDKMIANQEENKVFIQEMNLGAEEFKVALWHPGNDEEVIINWWKNQDRYYLFVPDAWMDSQLYWIYNMDDAIYVNNEKVVSGDLFELQEGTYQVKRQSGEEIALEVMYSSNIASLFIDTDKTDLEYLHESKEHAYSGDYKLYDEFGKCTFEGELESIACRGNASFDEHEKKSYIMRFMEETDLLGFGAAKKWLLISNDYDKSLMRNMFVDQMGRTAGLQYMPDMDYVDLYINGTYYGNYLLSEKIEVSEARVDIYNLEEEIKRLNADMDYKDNSAIETEMDTLSSIKWCDIDNEPKEYEGGYLLELDYSYRYEQEESGFVTAHSQCVTIQSPKYASYNQVNYISGLYQEFENAIYSENASGTDYEEYIDIDSFVRHYLIDEITKQLDASKTSFYMYKPHSERKLYAGPLWDYDKCLWCNHGEETRDPNGIFAASRKNDASEGDVWYGLYQKEAFLNDVKQEYKNRMRDITLQTCEEWMPKTQDRIAKSAYMNTVRWHLNDKEFDIASIKEEYDMEMERINQFVLKRLEFLDQEWK